VAGVRATVWQGLKWASVSRKSASTKHENGMRRKNSLWSLVRTNPGNCSGAGLSSRVPRPCTSSAERFMHVRVGTPPLDELALYVCKSRQAAMVTGDQEREPTARWAAVNGAGASMVATFTFAAETRMLIAQTLLEPVSRFPKVVPQASVVGQVGGFGPELVRKIARLVGGTT
jgi:hypothetical protein